MEDWAIVSVAPSGSAHRLGALPVGDGSLDRLMSGALGPRGDDVTHIEHVPARPARTTEWPAWVSPLVADRLRLAGVERLWTHQAEAASLAWSGRSTVVAR